jgi:hypothetical protein
MCRLGAGHPKDPTCGLKGGFISESPPGELPPNESLGYFSFDG